MHSSETSYDQDEAEPGDRSEELKSYAVLKNRIHDLLMFHYGDQNKNLHLLSKLDPVDEPEISRDGDRERPTGKVLQAFPEETKFLLNIGPASGN
ncbi:unnamed protein product [Malus baccata var. baccata]